MYLRIKSITFILFCDFFSGGHGTHVCGIASGSVEDDYDNESNISFFRLLLIAYCLLYSF